MLRCDEGGARGPADVAGGVRGDRDRDDRLRLDFRLILTSDGDGESLFSFLDLLLPIMSFCSSICLKYEMINRTKMRESSSSKHFPAALIKLDSGNNAYSIIT